MFIFDTAFYIFTCVVLIQAIYYLGIFGRFAFFKEKKTPSSSKLPVSVIICAKNEAENLKSFLPSIINQSYPDFQIVLINDASRDNTLEVMTYFSERHSNIKIVDVKSNEAFWGNKKYALTLGIKASKHDVLLFIDADCKPLTKYWISEMVSCFNLEKSIVLGYGPYVKLKNSFLNKLIRFETLTTAISYFSYAKLGLPYMGVGRNLAYTKTRFFEINGFVDHIGVRSGDDDLFVNEAATKANTTICLAKESFTLSIPKTKYRSWFQQKRRHISTAKHYKPIHKVLLALFYLTNVLFWVLSITLLVVSKRYLIPIIGLMVFRFAIQYLIYGLSTKKLLEKDILILLPFLEIVLITFQLIIFITNIMSKPKHWK